MESSSELRACSYANCTQFCREKPGSIGGAHSANPTKSKTGAKSAIAVRPMVSVVGSGTGFDLHDMFFAAAFGVRSIFPDGIFTATRISQDPHARDTPQIILVTGPSSSSSSPKLERPCFPPLSLGLPTGGETTIARSSSDA